jgi:hypothetical protein
MQTKVYIKPVTWAGSTSYFLGFAPSRPEAEPLRRLNGYFLVCRTLQSARSAAAVEAARLGCDVVECKSYVGL